MNQEPETRNPLSEVLRLERELARRRALRDPAFFARRYLPHYVTVEPAPFHREVYACMTVASPTGESVGSPTGIGAASKKGSCPPFLDRRFAFAAPRGHAKSTLVTLIFPLWLLCTRRARFLVIVSDTAAQAEMFLEDIRHELEHNADLRADFGEMIGQTWRRDQVLTRTGVRIVAKGTGSSLRGLRSGSFRPDLILCDDIENEDNTATPDQRRKVWRWFSRTLMNTLDPNGEIWVIGTILHYDSLLNNLVRGSEERGIPRWPGKVWRALEEKDEGGTTEKGTGALSKKGSCPLLQALWPAMWPVEKLLARRREIGSLAFAQEFQNEPCGPEQAVFRAEWLEQPQVWYERAPDGLDFFQAVDPAISREDGADYFCHITLGHHAETGDLYVVDIVRDRLTFDRQVAVVIEQANRWQPVRIGIESVAYQAGLADAVAARAALPLVRIQSPRDKFIRALRLSAVIENGKLKLRRGDARMHALRDELIQFPHAAHDDQVDALGYAAALAAQKVEPRVWLV
jgi:predicted phage terminase large subunit-like protein